MIVIDCKQGSQEWRGHRLGVPSASRFSDLITPGTGDYSRSASRYMYELIAEQLIGEPVTGFMNEWMSRGHKMEAEAREIYAMKTGNEVEQIGLIYMNDRCDVLCSPDGLTCSRNKGLEIKCPSPQIMIKYIIDQKLPDEYKPQVQGGMLVSGLDEWDFVAYHPDFEPLILTIQRDEAYIKKLHACIIRFNLEMQDMKGKLEQHINR